MVDLTFPRADYPGLGDLDASYAGGTLYLGLGERHVLLRGRDPFDLTNEDRTGPQPFPPSPMGAYYGCLKFRNGKFFVKVGQKILRRDDPSGEWALYFHADRLFSQFEILPSGKVLLLCPTDRPTTLSTPALWDLEMRCSTGNEQMPLAELHSVGGSGRPERVHPFPDAVQAALRRTNGFPLVDRTFQMGNHFFLLNSQVGQVFLYDAGKGRMTLLETPWPRFDDRHVGWVEERGLRPPAEWGEVHVSCHAFPLKIHAYPQNERQVLFAVIMNSALDGNYASRMDAFEKNRGNRFAPLPRIYTPEERAAWSWMKYFIYDMPSGTFHACKNPRLEALRLDFNEHWVKASGEAIPLRKLGLAGPE
ncbi:MAG TPA: hypothetical protein VK188_04155 [Holophaga sp.]|nr:hypothetical protein [Holophaga sp.]